MNCVTQTSGQGLLLVRVPVKPFEIFKTTLIRTPHMTKLKELFFKARNKLWFTYFFPLIFRLDIVGSLDELVLELFTEIDFAKELYKDTIIFHILFFP